MVADGAPQRGIDRALRSDRPSLSAARPALPATMVPRHFSWDSFLLARNLGLISARNTRADLLVRDYLMLGRSVAQLVLLTAAAAAAVPSFTSLLPTLPPTLDAILAARGMREPTPIQRAALPRVDRFRISCCAVGPCWTGFPPSKSARRGNQGAWPLVPHAPRPSAPRQPVPAPRARVHVALPAWLA